MSAINVIVQSNAVHVLTDGAAYQSDGILSSIGPKVRPMPHLSCAVAMRGAYLGWAPIMEEVSASATSFDLLRERMPALLRACAEAYAHLLNQCDAGADFEIVVAGISETSGPSAYIVASHDRYGEPWELVPLTGLCITPANDEIHERMIAALPLDCTAEDIDPEEHGLAILEIQRAHLIENDGIEGKFCAVGGFGQLTTVTADAVTSQIIHRWPDNVGARLVG